MKKTLKIFGLSVCMAVAGTLLGNLPASPVKSEAQAQAKATTLDQLLNQVRQGRRQDNAVNQKRINDFRNARNRQAGLLRQAEADVAREEQISEQLEGVFNANDLVLGELEIQLAERLGAFGELFGVARQVAGDTRGQLDNSLVSAQFANRSVVLNAIATDKELPTMDQLRQLWYMLQLEMTEQGKVVTFASRVVDQEGNPREESVTRIGPFTAIANGRYLNFDSEIQELADLSRQPAGSWLSAADRLEDADEGEIVRAAIDPSSGAILSLLVQTPSLMERVKQGGIVGYVVIALAGIGLLIGFERIFTLSATASAVRRQVRSKKAGKGNPLGRILLAYEENQHAGVETIELKLDEAILRETPKLERGLNTLKVLAGVAPLLGLLGTVTGMIVTFQAITLFGTGDPKLMAGGISQALVTTVLGLVAAIPLLLLHSMASGRARTVQQILEEQSAGLVASQAEG